MDEHAQFIECYYCGEMFDIDEDDPDDIHHICKECQEEVYNGD